MEGEIAALRESSSPRAWRCSDIQASNLRLRAVAVKHVDADIEQLHSRLCAQALVLSLGIPDQAADLAQETICRYLEQRRAIRAADAREAWCRALLLSSCVLSGGPDRCSLYLMADWGQL